MINKPPVHRYRDTDIQRYRDTEIQRYRDTPDRDKDKKCCI